MQKLRLDMEALVVESFETHAVEGAGTVHARESFELIPGCGATGEECVDGTAGGGDATLACTYGGCTLDERCHTKITACSPAGGTCQYPCATWNDPTCYQQTACRPCTDYPLTCAC